jgi:hypothetical protein
MPFIIDTNVPIVANNRISAQATMPCVLACIQQLRDIMTKQIVVIDDQWRILREYGHKLDPKKQPGLGHIFYKWLFNNQFNPRHCQRLHITPLESSADGNDFAEFPNDPELANFDRSDRKFVAVALAHPDKPPIVNATDSDWQQYQTILATYGVKIEFLFPIPTRSQP